MAHAAGHQQAPAKVDQDLRLLDVRKLTIGFDFAN